MVNKLMQPQEIDVFYIIPAIKRDIALELKEQGYKQKDIAKVLCTTEPAISYYLTSKRATEVKFDEITKKEIKNAVSEIKDEKTLTTVIQKLLKKMNKCQIKCNICKKMISLDENCRICFR